MFETITAVARAHGLSESGIAALEAVLRGRPATVPTLDLDAPLRTLDPTDIGEPTLVAASTATNLPSRYEDLGLLGRGGMGEVRRVRDRVLNRTLAMKIGRAALGESPAAFSRFREEAQATAQLQHPNIVPVHDMGQLADGRIWFTMKEIRGQTLAEAIAAVHGAGAAARPAAWSLRGLVTAFHAVCQAVAYAHSRGVLHRDLKPDNVMLGDYGEVYVLDWGLARVLGRSDRPLAPDPMPFGGVNEAVETSHRSRSPTRVGQVAGTPAYMPPEQALGAVDQIDARSDVYALGAILYELLSGRPPYQGNARSVLAQVLRGPPIPLEPDAPVAAQVLSSLGSPRLPAELVAACQRAMARQARDRHASAGDLSKEVGDWLDGARRREQALAVVEAAQAKKPLRADLLAQAADRRAAATLTLAALEPWRPEEDKAGAWAQEDEAADLERQADRLDLDEEHLLRAALTHSPDLAEAHAALAWRYRADHAAAEARRADPNLPEARLRLHAAALPTLHPDRARHFAYLQGDGALSLATDPPGAEVHLFRFTPQRRRLVPIWVRSLGQTPLVAVTLPMGSYLLELRHPDRATVRYPVAIGRGEHWDGCPPGGGAPAPIPLPRPADLGADDCYVPPGWFWAGGDPHSVSALPLTRAWVDGFVLRRFPVTNRAYLAFLDALVAQGRTEEALRHAPRERGGTAGELGALIYGFDGRRFSLRPDADGDIWEPDWPVLMVDWFGAQAYAAHQAALDGLPWTLPGDLAWEKAARGVDRRFYPWGDTFDPSWAHTRDSHRGRPVVAPVDTYPVDQSVYGVRGLAGNTLDWIADLRTEAEGADWRQHRTYRGGGWYDSPWGARVANRGGNDPGHRDGYIGIRLARPFPTHRQREPDDGRPT